MSLSEYIFLLKQDKFDGWGEAFYDNGSVYVGYWQLGKKHGYGKMKVIDHSGNLKEIYSGNLIKLLFIMLFV